MAFVFARGPVQTKVTVQQIASSLQEVADGKRFMTIGRRLGSNLREDGALQVFRPAANDDPFYAGEEPAFQVGFRISMKARYPMGIVKEFGYQVIFRVYERSACREVRVEARGNCMRREVERLIKHAFALL